MVTATISYTDAKVIPGNNSVGLEASNMKIVYKTITQTKTTSITAFADYSGTVPGTVSVTSASHGLSTNDYVTITDTTNYNATYQITKINDNSFYVTAAWVANDATGNIYPCYVAGGFNCDFRPYSKDGVTEPSQVKFYTGVNFNYNYRYDSANHKVLVYDLTTGVELVDGSDLSKKTVKAKLMFF